MRIFSVINIDIVGSRKLKNRAFIQEDLNKYIKELNLEFRDVLASPITFILGDEWQIVLKKPSRSYHIIDKFQRFLKKENIDIYAGIGMGTISTDVYEDTRLMDGECFVKAREALSIVKNKNRFYNKQLNSKKNNIYFNAKELPFIEQYALGSSTYKEVALTSDEDKLDGVYINKIINTLIENNEILKNKITDKQLKIIELYEELGSYNNIVKKSEDISKADISQKLNSSNYFVIDNNNYLIESLLELYCAIRKGN